jgi:urease accessory protein
MKSVHEMNHLGAHQGGAHHGAAGRPDPNLTPSRHDMTQTSTRSARSFRLTLGALLAAAPALALAHGGADGGAHHGFLDGLTHPFTGIDHLAAMLAVGFWSALGTRHIAVAPLSFAAVLLFGAVLGLQGVALPAIEPMIAASLLAIGLLAATRTRLPSAAAGLLVAVFALFHGAAHGIELAGDSAVATLAGMLIGTAVLHAAGLLAGLAVRSRSQWFARIAGLAVAGLGAALLVPMMVLR